MDIVRYATESIRDVLPAYVIAFFGSAADYVTTRIGLGMGYHETHPYYSPFLSIAIFFSTITLLALILPKAPRWTRWIVFFLSSWSFLGAVNNTLVILGVFGGLVI